MALQLYGQGKFPGTPVNRSMGGHHRWSGHVGKVRRKYFYPAGNWKKILRFSSP